jgi:hypothetical protein
MDTLITLNFIGYAAVLGGGLVLGTLFGRSLLSDAASIATSLDARVSALESALHIGSAATTASEATGAAIKTHAAATEKLATAIETHAAATTKAAAN